MRRALLYSRSYRNAVLALGPVGYWRLGEASGTVAADETGRNHGTYVGSPTFGAAGLLSGDPNTAVTLGTAYVKTAAPVTTVVDNWTMLAWIKPSAPGVLQTVIENGESPYGYSLLLDTTGRLWGLRDGASNVLVSNTGPVISQTEPSMAVLLRRAGTSYIYLNGALSVTGTTSAPSAPATQTTIGASTAPGAAYWTMSGQSDEPAIFDRALSPADIARLHQIGRGF